jgi:ABC-type dipeptide/oligopeptide/nickel transport system permease subunit
VTEMSREQLTKSVTEFGRMYLRNRMGQAGLLLLLIFIGMATLAPYLTPYDPMYTMQLANFRAKPQWLDPTLPPNLYLVQSPSLATADALNEWSIEASGGSTISWTGSNGYPGIPLVEEGSGPGAVEVTAPSGEATATISKTYQYNYKPPRRFSVHVAYMAEVTGDATWSIQALLRQSDGTTLMLWTSGPQKRSQDWTVPRPQIDTNDAILRLRLFNDILGDASKMFPQVGEYQLIFKVTTETEGGSVKVYLDDMSARIWGESFGYLGTDNYGRDIFTQLMHGSRISIIVGIFSAVIAVTLGVLVGLTSGYIGGWVDELLMRVNDVLLTIPGLPFLIVLTAVLGPTILSVIILIGFLGWMGIARLIRSQVLTLKTKAFVEASKASGGGTWHIIRVHLIPNVMTMAYTQLALTVPGAIVTEAALSFLGLGDPFLQTWGKMLHDVQYYGAVAEWWWAVPPGLCIALLSMSFVFIGYAMDDIFNPKLRGR